MIQMEMFKDKKPQRHLTKGAAREAEYIALVSKISIYSWLSVLMTVYGVFIAHAFIIFGDGWAIHHPLSVKLEYHFLEWILLIPNFIAMYIGLIAFNYDYVWYYRNMISIALVANAVFFLFEIGILETALLSTDPVIPTIQIWAYASIVAVFGIAVIYTSYILMEVSNYLRPMEPNIIYPRNIAEVQEVIRKARLLGKKVRCVGSGHSFPEQIREPDSREDYLISLAEINNVGVEFQLDGTILARCGAGVYLGESPGRATQEESLLYQLDHHPAGPFSLPDLGGITHQAVGGFLSTGSSGGSTTYDLGDVIYSITIVDGLGEIKRYSREDPDGKFYGAVVSMGLLGIIVEVEFLLEQVYPGEVYPYTYNIKGTENTFWEAEKIGEMTEIMKTAEYSRILWFPQNNVKEIQIWQAQRIPKRDNAKIEPYVNIPLVWGSHIPLQILSGLFYRWFMAFKPPVPPFMYFVIGKLIKLFVVVDDNKSFLDYWWRGLPMDNQMSDKLMGVEFTEAWMPIEESDRIITLLRNFYDQDVGYDRTGNFSVEIYPAKASKFWMHAGYGGDKVRIDIFWFQSKWGNPIDYYTMFWDLFELNGLNPVYHPGKYQPHPTSEEELERRYPMIQQFKSLREEHDPDNIFMNEYWARVLNIPLNR